MRGMAIFVGWWLLAVGACGDPATFADAASIDGPPADAAVDGVETDACATRIVLEGGTDLEAQGWSVAQSGSAQLSVGATFTQLQTATVGTAGGHLLLYLVDAVTPGTPFIVEVDLQVTAVAPHNQFDAAVAIMGSFTPTFGSGTERAQMIYIDSGGLGWADDTEGFTTTAVEGELHTYRLAVDAAGAATVSRDGQPALTRAGFVTNGTIAIGDQTNDTDVESTIQVRSVSLLCP